MYFIPSNDIECRICGETPTVIVHGHECPETELCSKHFFGHWIPIEDWNEE